MNDDLPIIDSFLFGYAHHPGTDTATVESKLRRASRMPKI